MIYFTASHHYATTELGCRSEGYAGVLETGNWKFKTLAEARRAGKRRPKDARKGSKVAVEISRHEPLRFRGTGKWGFVKGRMYTSKCQHTRELVEKFAI